MFEKRKVCEKGSTEYKKWSTAINEEYKKRSSIKTTYRAISALKNEIEDKYEINSPIAVGFLKSSILIELASKGEWGFDVPGFVTKDDVKYITSNDVYKIRGYQTLNNKRLGKDAYYVRAKDLRPFTDIRNIF